MGCNILKCTCGPKKHLPQRYMVAIMSLTGILLGYGHRVSLNIAITVMANKTLSESTSCPKRNVSIDTGPKELSGGVIDWTNHQQNLVLGAFYPGYFVGHLPAGILSDVYGGRYVFAIGMMISTALTLVTPIVVVTTPYYITIVLRNLMGLGQSVIYVAISALYAKWVPKEERSMLGAFSFAANSLGIVFGNFLTGMIINALKNWPVGFYFWGGLGIIWCTIFIIYIYSEPATSKVITPSEKEFLATAVHKGNKKLKIPWLSFLYDIGLWAIIVSEVGHDFTVFTLVNNFPKYLSDVLHYDLAENAVASSLPYLLQWVGGLTAGQLVDYLIKKKGANVRLCRVVVTSIGSVVPATFVLAAGYMGCDGTLVIVMYAFNLLFKGPIYAAMKINHLDLSFNFAGILMALSNGIGALAGYLSPEVINRLAPDNTIEQWQLVFWVVWWAAFLTNLFYVFFARASRRKWDVGPEEMDDFLKEEAEKKAAKQKKKEEKKARKAKAKESEAGTSK